MTALRKDYDSATLSFDGALISRFNGSSGIGGRCCTAAQLPMGHRQESLMWIRAQTKQKLWLHMKLLKNRCRQSERGNIDEQDRMRLEIPTQSAAMNGIDDHRDTWRGLVLIHVEPLALSDGGVRCLRIVQLEALEGSGDGTRSEIGSAILLLLCFHVGLRVLVLVLKSGAGHASEDCRGRVDTKDSFERFFYKKGQTLHARPSRVGYMLGGRRSGELLEKGTTSTLALGSWTGIESRAAKNGQNLRTRRRFRTSAPLAQGSATSRSRGKTAVGDGIVSAARFVDVKVGRTTLSRNIPWRPVLESLGLTNSLTKLFGRKAASKKARTPGFSVWIAFAGSLISLGHNWWPCGLLSDKYPHDIRSATAHLDSRKLSLSIVTLWAGCRCERSGATQRIIGPSSPATIAHKPRSPDPARSPNPWPEVLDQLDENLKTLNKGEPSQHFPDIPKLFKLRPLGRIQISYDIVCQFRIKIPRLHAAHSTAHWQVPPGCRRIDGEGRETGWQIARRPSSPPPALKPKL
ncbi:hypothetical protein C8F01DRAFT_1092610 [Mycena amicta]|nr:hypothetical protein C8F01DRAFT_1092610 [Mycena amicta]